MRLLLCILLFVFAFPCEAETKKKRRRSLKKKTHRVLKKKQRVLSSKNEKVSKKRKQKMLRVEQMMVSEKRVGKNRRIHRYRTNLGFGMNMVGSTSTVSMSAQFGYAFWDGNRFYLGPDVSFALNSPSSLITLLAGTWYEFRFKKAPKTGISLGVGAGAAIAESFPDVGATELAFLGDIALTRELNDLVSIRGQFRPGWIGPNFSFAMRFNVAFRFP